MLRKLLIIHMSAPDISLFTGDGPPFGILLGPLTTVWRRTCRRGNQRQPLGRRFSAEAEGSLAEGPVKICLSRMITIPFPGRTVRSKLDSWAAPRYRR